MDPAGRCRFEAVLQPVSGKAVEVYEGEVLRITQVAGEQCVDLNCFNAHDYTEHMSVSDTRAQGFRVREGHVIVSSAPHSRPMLAISHMADTCLTDLLGARCDGTPGERAWGMDDRTNCQDTLAEAISEYGLTPDDVHDSLNLWMHSQWTDSGMIIGDRAIGPVGDFVELVALMDVVAVPVICGSGDLGPVSNYWFKPIRLEVFEVSTESSSIAREYLDRYGGYENQRARDEWGVPAIRAERELRPVPGYVPSFRHLPLRHHEVSVDLRPDDVRRIEPLIGVMGQTPGDVVRSIFMYWYLKNRARPPILRP